MLCVDHEYLQKNKCTISSLISYPFVEVKRVKFTGLFHNEQIPPKSIEFNVEFPQLYAMSIHCEKNVMKIYFELTENSN